MQVLRVIYAVSGFLRAPYCAVLLSCLALASCSSTQAQVSDLRVAPSLAGNPTVPSPPVHMLGHGDKLRITVYGEPQLSGEFAVDASGNFALPLVGQMAAAGKSVRDVERDVTSKLKGRYLVDPKVNVEIASYRPIYVIGEVKTSGEYPYSPGLNAVTAVALAGGFTPRASPSTIYIKRANAVAEQELALGANVAVYPGDLIRVPERYF